MASEAKETGPEKPGSNPVIPDPWFSELAEQLDNSLQRAKAEYSDLQYFIDASKTVSDLKALVDADSLIALAGESKSHREFLEELVLCKPLTKPSLAGVCGYYIVTHAADHVVKSVRRGLLAKPAALCKPLARRGFSPARTNQKLREFWNKSIVPKLKKSYPKKFQSKSRDSWGPVYENIAACRLLAELAARKNAVDPAKGEAGDEGNPHAGKKSPKLEGNQLPACSSWLLPAMSLTALANRLGNVGSKRARSMLEPYGLRLWRPDNRQLWTVCLDDLPLNYRAKLQET